MPTTFGEIYDRAVFRFSDYDFMKINVQAREDILERYLKSAIADFAKVCNLAADYENKVFTTELTEEEKEILALGVDYHWFSAKVQNSELLRNSMSTKDYTFFSPANLMRELRNLRNDLKTEFASAVTKYSYNHGDFGSLKEPG